MFETCLIYGLPLCEGLECPCFLDQCSQNGRSTLTRPFLSVLRLYLIIRELCLVCWFWGSCED